MAAEWAAGQWVAGQWMAADWVAGREAWFAWALLGAGSGVLAGAAGRVLLERLRRGTRIPPPWCELAVGGLWALVAAGAATGLVPLAWVPVLAGAAWLAVVAGAVDVRHHRLPDALTLPAFPAALLAVVPLGGAAVGRAVAGGVVLAVVHLLVHTVSPDALGLGDVKLAAPVGAVLAAGSWSALVLGCALSALFSGLLGVVVGFRRLVRSRRRTPGSTDEAARDGAPAASARVAGAWRARPESRAPCPTPGHGRPRAISPQPEVRSPRETELRQQAEPTGRHGSPRRAEASGRTAASGRTSASGLTELPWRAEHPWRTELPHGPSMLAAAWLTAAATAVGAALTGPVGAVTGG